MTGNRDAQCGAAVTITCPTCCVGASAVAAIAGEVAGVDSLLGATKSFSDGGGGHLISSRDQITWGWV